MKKNYDWIDFGPIRKYVLYQAEKGRAKLLRRKYEYTNLIYRGEKDKEGDADISIKEIRGRGKRTDIIDLDTYRLDNPNVKVTSIRQIGVYKGFVEGTEKDINRLEEATRNFHVFISKEISSLMLKKRKIERRLEKLFSYS